MAQHWIYEKTPIVVPVKKRKFNNYFGDNIMYKLLVLKCRHCLIKGLEINMDEAYEVCKHPECNIDGQKQRPLEQNQDVVPPWCPLREGHTEIDLAAGV